MSLEWLIELAGDGGAELIGGLFVGLLFGISAQRSQFCLRAATVEFWRGALGPKTAIWLVVFGTSLLGVQILFELGSLKVDSVRQLAQSGSLSGALIGGLLFGAGMILARGCASRLLVLSATGNLRAIVAGLILTVVAQASFRGVLSPLRAELASGWMIGPELRNLMGIAPVHSGLVIGVATLGLALLLVRRHGVRTSTAAWAAGVGAAVVLGWWFTAELSRQSFEPVAVQSVSFTGPSTDTLMAFINQPTVPPSFGIGLIPGVFIGSLIAALMSGEFRLQSFSSEAPLPRYVVGACLMGFGSMLAGGCAVGAGVTGGAVLALTAWVALMAMWVGAGLTDWVVDRRQTNLNWPRVAGGRSPMPPVSAG